MRALMALNCKATKTLESDAVLYGNRPLGRGILVACHKLIMWYILHLYRPFLASNWEGCPGTGTSPAATRPRIAETNSGDAVVGSLVTMGRRPARVPVMTCNDLPQIWWAV